MKQLATIALLGALAACMGCESTPKVNPVNIPPAPETVPLEETPTPVEAEVLFAADDQVIIHNGDGTTLDGVIIAVGPMMPWLNTETKEEITSRVYLVRVVINGLESFGEIPEFALTKRN